MRKYFKLMRIHHYIKNFLVFAPLACSGQFFYADKLLKGIMGFVVFCMVSSVVYIVNDIQDKEKDQEHPVKCKRPLAAGDISVRSAYILVLVLLIGTIICSFFIFNINAFLLLVLYLFLNLGYSFGLKNVPILDVSILVSGFVIRILYGAFVTEISISNWLYLTVIAMAFYLSLGKRRNELRQREDGNTRQVLKSYSLGFLDKNMYMCLALANVFYALWSMDKDTISLYNSRNLIFTFPIVLLITMKYSLNIEGESDGDPVEVLIHDKILLILCILYLAVMFVILYI